MAKKAKRAAKKSKRKTRPSTKRKSAKSAAKSGVKAKSARKVKPAKRAPGAGKKRIKSVKAIANMQPPRPYKFRADARVTVGNPGQRARLVPAVPQGINPRILLLNVVVNQLPGVWPQVETDTDANYTDPDYRGSYSQVTVLYDGESKTANVQIVS
jgi:hypothetical protein